MRKSCLYVPNCAWVNRRTRTRGARKVAAKAMTLPAINTRAGLTVDPMEVSGRDRLRARGRRRVVLPAAADPVEHALDLAAHERGREAARAVGTGVLPEEAPRHGQAGMAEVAMAAGREGQPVAGRRHLVDHRAVEPAVGIGEVADGRAQPPFQLLPRAVHLVAHARGVL